MSKKYQELAQKIQEARIIGKKAADAVEDKGTCNLDKVVIYGLPKVRETEVCLYIEDARKRTWFGSADAHMQRSCAGIREGIGSVKRDAHIWEDWCKENKINYKMIHPRDNCTKYKSDVFKKVTGWLGRTNEHARDAAMLVYRRYARF